MEIRVALRRPNRQPSRRVATAGLIPGPSVDNVSCKGFPR